MPGPLGLLNRRIFLTSHSTRTSPADDGGRPSARTLRSRSVSGTTHWRLWRRCPECEWSCQGVHGEREIDAFDEQLDLGAHELADELRALELANMADMAKVFVAALGADLIGADDFQL